MTGAGEQQDLLPGLRASVADSRQKAKATRAKKARRGRARRGAAGRAGAGRRAAGPPGPHLRLPGARVDGRATRSRACGSRCGSPARTSTATSSARVDDSEHAGRLTPLRRVVSAERVLSPAIAELAGDLAQRYAGVRSDVLRLAVPPRHATTEKQPSDAGAGRARTWRRRGGDRGVGAPRPRGDVPPAPARRRRAAGGLERGAGRRLAHACSPTPPARPRPVAGAR